MNLKEFAKKILDNSLYWDYDIQYGIMSLDNDVQDISYLTVFNDKIDISDCYIESSIHE